MVYVKVSLLIVVLCVICVILVVVVLMVKLGVKDFGVIDVLLFSDLDKNYDGKFV